MFTGLLHPGSCSAAGCPRVAGCVMTLHAVAQVSEATARRGSIIQPNIREVSNMQLDRKNILYKLLRSLGLESNYCSRTALAWTVDSTFNTTVHYHGAIWC